MPATRNEANDQINKAADAGKTVADEAARTVLSGLAPASIA